MFRYDLKKKIFSSVGKITVLDTKKNKYFFTEIHVDTEKKEMIGSDVSVLFDQENFGLSKENDPRFVANDIFMTEEESKLSKGIFTVCKKKGDECPPWTLQAEEIRHNKTKKTIYYKNAILKVYDVPIFYFPRFFHPDPTVKRQSGFLNPIFTNSTSVGAGFGLPYYWAINNSKDFTFTPKVYGKENMLFLNEYRQAFKNGFLSLESGYTQGYKETTAKKTNGSRSYVFGELDFNLAKDSSYKSNFHLKTQRTSNDTFFKIHDIDTTLVDSENTNLNNKISYSFSKDNYYFDISGSMYEDLSKKTNSRYEYVLPNVLFGKSIFTEKSGYFNIESSTSYKNYDVNKTLTSFTNNLLWTSPNKISKNGFVNSLSGSVKNRNYEAENTDDYKKNGVINELNRSISYKTSRPLKKENDNFLNLFTPNFMIRFAPGHMRDLSGNDLNLKYSNLYSLNKTSEIESGLSAVLGFDYKNSIKNNNNIQEKLSISMGQVFSQKRNKDLPMQSSLDQKMSDIVGEINYNFSEISTINYKFSLDHNLNDLNSNQVSTSLNFNKVSFNLDYLEKQNHVGSDHYVNAGVSLNINDNNSLSFETKKNFKTDSTELYNISYQYEIDCLTAGLIYRREFYEDSDLDQKDSLMFTITFIPFTGVKSPSFINP